MPVTTSKMCQLTNRMDDKPILLGGWLMFGVASQIASLNVQHNKSIFHHAKTSQTKIMSVGRRCCWGMSLRVNFRELSRKIIHQRDSWSALLFNTQQMLEFMKICQQIYGNLCFPCDGQNHPDRTSTPAKQQETFFQRPFDTFFPTERSQNIWPKNPFSHAMHQSCNRINFDKWNPCETQARSLKSRSFLLVDGTTDFVDNRAPKNDSDAMWTLSVFIKMKLRAEACLLGCCNELLSNTKVVPPLSIFNRSFSS